MASLSKSEMLLLSQLGYTFYREGQYEKAISFFEGLSELQPDFPQFHSVLAVLYHVTHRTEAALREAKLAMQLRPADVSLMITVGEIYLSQGQLTAAREVLNRALAEAARTRHPAVPRITLLLQNA